MSPVYVLNKDKNQNPDREKSTNPEESVISVKLTTFSYSAWDYLPVNKCLRTGMGPCDDAHRQACDERQICMKSVEYRAKENYEKCRKLTITVEEGV